MRPETQENPQTTREAADASPANHGRTTARAQRTGATKTVSPKVAEIAFVALELACPKF